MSFFFYSKRRCNEELKPLGTALASLFATDNEIKYVLDYEQPLLLASPVRRIKAGFFRRGACGADAEKMKNCLQFSSFLL